MVRASDHLSLLNDILAYYDLSAVRLEIVPDVKAWCDRNGINERSPTRAAKCFPDENLIVTRNEQTDSMISSVKSAIDYRRGCDGVVGSLDSDVKYLAHLMLHEVACFKVRTFDQARRDNWAFAELVNHVA